MGVHLSVEIRMRNSAGGAQRSAQTWAKSRRIEGAFGRERL